MRHHWLRQLRAPRRHNRAHDAADAQRTEQQPELRGAAMQTGTGEYRIQ